MTDLGVFEARIQTLFCERLDREVPSIDTDLLDTGLLDSLLLVDLLMYLEQDLGVAMDLGAIELEQLRTVAGMARMVRDFLATCASESRGPQATPS